MPQLKSSKVYRRGLTGPTARHSKAEGESDPLPRIHVSNRAPEPGDMTREGDIWVQYDKDDKNE